MAGAVKGSQPGGDVFAQAQVAVVRAVPERGEGYVVIAEDAVGCSIEQACGEQGLVWPSGAVSWGGSV